jgi:hypothetical protein
MAASASPKSGAIAVAARSTCSAVGVLPATTRDSLEFSDVWSGIAVTRIGTAGMRATDDPVEQRGIALGEAGSRRPISSWCQQQVAACDDSARFADCTVVVRTGVPPELRDHRAPGTDPIQRDLTGNNMILLGIRFWGNASADDLRGQATRRDRSAQDRVVNDGVPRGTVVRGSPTAPW